MKNDMPIRYLINDNGKPFNSSEFTSLTQELDRLSDEDRENYRNNNCYQRREYHN